MGDYPDPDEEYELMYADELGMLQDEDDHTDGNTVKPKTLAAKRSLNFSSSASQISSKFQKAHDEITLSQSIQPLPSGQDTFTPNLPVESTGPTNERLLSSDISDCVTPSTNGTDKINSADISGPCKRTVHDLFGDIGDIDFDDIQLPRKKQKTEEENDLDLIEKILEGRRLRQILAEPSGKMQANTHSVYNRKENLSLDIPRWSFQPLTNSDGERIYVRLEGEESWEQGLDAAPECVSLQAMYTATWDEARKLLEAKQASSSQPAPAPAPVEAGQDCLWVDKYQPRCYVELLSEEPVNRAVLHWLHLWDKIVFNKEVKTVEPQQRSSFVKRTGQFQLQSQWRGKREAEPELDEAGRPRHKVALLCGPPGVGKTTLAHLLAKLAGYRPVELNASDERSTDAFRSALQSATLMRSVLDQERRPNCLILDEIDGAPLPTVELLVRWCTAAEGGKKKGQAHALRRPVIAICNDLYAAALRPLRPVSLVVQVGGVSRARLAARLTRVAACEGVLAGAHVCAALAARAAGDVRAAIQLLSFVKGRAKAQLRLCDVESAAVGWKDCQRSLLQALTAVFTLQDSQPRAAAAAVHAAGDYDRLADGIFENYLCARVDSRLALACETLSWLRLHDTIHSWTLRHQNYSLYGVLPLCIVRCHQILASRAPQRIKFPMQAQEMYRKKLELDSISQSVSRGCVPSVACSRRALHADIIPLLPHILRVSLRSANVQLCSEGERRALAACAGALCDYGLQYVQQRTQDGLYAHVLEPDIYKLAFYGNEEKARPPPGTRQALAREQQLETIRRNELMASRVSTRPGRETAARRSGEPTSMKAATTTTTSITTSTSKEARLPNHLQRLQPREVARTTPQVHKDFFGRIVPLSQVQRSDAAADVISSSSVFYQYREGFNNAVRRNLRTKDLL